MKKKVLKKLIFIFLIMSLVTVAVPLQFGSVEVFAATTQVPDVRTSAPGKSNKYFYDKNYNPFLSYGYNGSPLCSPSGGNCTWYAYGRASEYLGKKSNLPTGNAGTWYNTWKNKGRSVGSVPRPGSVICWGYKNGGAGHVAFVEKVKDNGDIYVSNSGWSVIPSWSGSKRNGNISYGWIKKGGNKWKLWAGTQCETVFKGFLYLDNANYSIGYNLTGGSGNIPDQTVAYGKTFKISNTKPQRSGYTFKCWYLKRLKDQKWYVGGKYGWCTWDDIVKYKYTPKSYAPGTSLALDKSWIDNGGDNSKFRFAAQWMPVGTRTINDGTYYITTKLRSDRCVTVQNESKDNGANIQLGALNGNVSQAWKVTYLNDGYYSIQNVNSGKSLDVTDGGIHSGTNVQQWAGVNEYQKWVISRKSDGTYSIRAKWNGHYLDLRLAETAVGTNIIMWEDNSGDNQRWNFVQYVPPCTHSSTEIRNARSATCTSSGYTGDTYCRSCGAKLSSGTTISALGHSFDGGRITKEATYTEEGVRTHTCTRCGFAITETVPVRERPAESQPAISTRKPADQKSDVSESTDAGATGQVLVNSVNEKDLPGSTFGLLEARAAKSDKTFQKIIWSKVHGASKYIIYGSRCGGSNRLEKLAETSGTSYTHKRLLKGTYYKYIVVAVNGGNKALASSKMIYSATAGGKVGNYKKITTSAKSNKVTVKTGMSFKLNARGIAESKKLKISKYRAICYESGNSQIASVSSKGVIRARCRGTCYIYAYAQNGAFTRIKVVVK